MAAEGANAFRAALGRIGFSAEAQNAVTDEGMGGIANITQLARLHKDQIKRVCKVLRDNEVPVSVMAEQMFEAMRYWVKQRLRLQQPVASALFTEEVAEETAQRFAIAQDELAAKATDKEGLKMPDKFKHGTNFRVYDEVMDTYLNQFLGVSNVPINYVVRKQDEPEEDAVYENEAEEAVAIAPLVGDVFDIDNRRVYGIIKSLIIEGPAWAFITPTVDRAKDGRAAWLLLRDHYGNESFMNRDIEEAYNQIDALHYKKEYANFSFEDFITQLTKHYNTLERNAEYVSEEKKVRDLLKKITDPTLEAAKQAIRINPMYKQDFSLAANFLSSSVTPLTKGRERTISSIKQQQNKQKNSQQNSKGRGRGGDGRGGSAATGYIQPEDWSKMSREQQNSVLEARGTKRHIEAITANPPVEPSVPSQVTATGTNVSVITTDVPTVNSQAGREFGRQAHRG